MDDNNVSNVSGSNGLWRFRTWSEHWRRTHRDFKCCGMLNGGLPTSTIQPRRWRQPRETGVVPTGPIYCALLNAAARPNVSPIPVALEVLPALFGSNGNDIVQLWLSGDQDFGFLALPKSVDTLVLAAIRRQIDGGLAGR